MRAAMGPLLSLLILLSRAQGGAQDGGVPSAICHVLYRAAGLAHDFSEGLGRAAASLAALGCLAAAAGTARPGCATRERLPGDQRVTGLWLLKRGGSVRLMEMINN